MSELISQAKTYVKELLSGEASGHDWFHILRVYNTAKSIAHQMDGVDLEIVELGALLHDVGDHKFHGGDHTVGPKMVTEWLASHHASTEVVQKVVAIVKEISYKGAEVATPMSSAEGQIVQDADRLDAIGAIGIARTFAFGGNKNRLMYDPDVPPEMHQDFDSYKKTTAPTINHFYEKLLLLKDRMNTPVGKKMAIERHVYMEQFLNQFYAEWNGER